MLRATTDRRNAFGVKDSSDQYRNGGARILWVDGRTDELTARIISAIRSAGFKAWRTGDQIWVRSIDADKIAALHIPTDR